MNEDIDAVIDCGLQGWYDELSQVSDEMYNVCIVAVYTDLWMFLENQLEKANSVELENIIREQIDKIKVMLLGLW